MQAHAIFRDGYTPSHESIEYHQFAFPTPKPQGENLTMNTKEFQNLEDAKRYRILEERLSAMEGQDTHDFDVPALCLVEDVVYPLKFKMPDFEKYKGSSCPKTHLKMYVRKMAAYPRDNKLLIHCFQESLSGASLEWYTQLERNHVPTWNDLAVEFQRHYQYNTDMAPSHTQLQDLSQRSNESFKEYAQRWRELAARVQPPLLDKELIDMFICTLQGQYYEKMLGSISSRFSDLVIVREHIENGIKTGKIQSISSDSTSESLRYFQVGEENETSAIWEM